MRSGAREWMWLRARDEGMGEDVDTDVGQGKGKSKVVGENIMAADPSVLVGAGIGVPVGTGPCEAWCPSWRRVRY